MSQLRKVRTRHTVHSGNGLGIYARMLISWLRVPGGQALGAALAA
jgi:hypothetical protein